jgi:hypothetical protein
MKTKNEEMDFDFIGGQGNLTIEEENQLANYFRQKKSVSIKIQTTQQNKSSKFQIQTN